MEGPLPFMGMGGRWEAFPADATGWGQAAGFRLPSHIVGLGMPSLGQSGPPSPSKGGSSPQQPNKTHLEGQALPCTPRIQEHSPSGDPETHLNAHISSSKTAMQRPLFALGMQPRGVCPK